MILRFISYLCLLLLGIELILLSAVSWSFYESSNSSLNLLRYTSDNKARDILSTIARVAETKLSPYGYEEMNDFFYRLVKQSERDLDKFTILEIVFISTEGKVLSHSNPKYIEEDFSKRGSSTKYSKAFFLKPPTRMKKGQNPTPRNFGKPFKGDGSFFNNVYLDYFPEIKNQTVIVSAPVFHQQTLENQGSVHIIYNRGNFLFFLDRQKDIFLWMLINYVIIGFILSIFLWVLHVIFILISFKEGLKEVHENQDSIPDSNFVTSPTATITAILKNEVFSKSEKLLKTKQLEILKEEPTNPKKEDAEEKNTDIFTFSDNSIEIPVDFEDSSRDSHRLGNNKNGKSNKDVLDAIYLE
jgi:hypothetical protein